MMPARRQDRLPESGDDFFMTTNQADARFLRVILVALVGATLVTGLMAVVTTVRALPGQVIEQTPDAR
jgi:hypothetical protein